jgi:hypothetical protein
VDTGSTGLAEYGDQLASDGRDAYVRALLRAVDSGWELHYLWALVGMEPPEWTEQTWRYERLAFVACQIPAADLTAVCATTPGGVLALGEFQGIIPAAIGPANWTRQPSYGRHDRPVLPWPATDFRIAAAGSSGRNLPHDLLVGDACPSFPEPNSAWRAFFEGDFSLTGAQNPPNELASVRVIQEAGWLGRIRVTATQLAVEVRGGSLDGCELELSGVTGRAAQPVSSPGELIFPLESGLPEHAWLWLKNGTRWLDYRSIDPRSGWTGDLARAGVDIDVPADPQANIEALLAAGEGPHLEYKSRLPEDAVQKRRVFKTVAAFATGGGGTVVFGVDPDELTVTGLGDEDPKKLRDRLYDLVHRTVIPSPDVTVEDHQAKGQTILVLHVAPGPMPPYGIAVDKGSRDKPEFYVRRGASTPPAQPGELREAARNRPSPGTAPGQSIAHGPWW